MTDQSAPRTSQHDRTQDKDTGRTWPWLVGGFAILCVAAAGFWFLTRSGDAEETAAPKPPLIELARVEPASTVAIRQTGFLRPVADVAVVSEINARIVEVADAFTRGSSVSEGDMLVRLDTSRLEAELRRADASIGQAEAVIAEARISVERQETLEARNVASEATLQQALVELATAEAALQTARAERNLIEQSLDDAVIRAPFDAIVAESTADTGALAATGATLGRLIALAQAEVELGLTPADVALLGDAEGAIGSDVRILASPVAGEDAPHIATGTVTAIGPQIAADTRTITLIVRIERPFEAGRDGIPDARPLRIDELLTLELSVDLSSRGAVAVPARALKSGDVVWTVRDGTLRRAGVDVLRRGAGDDGTVILGSGAPDAGVDVMLTDLASAADGQKVRSETSDNAGEDRAQEGQ